MSIQPQVEPQTQAKTKSQVQTNTQNVAPRFTPIPQTQTQTPIRTPSEVSLKLVIDMKGKRILYGEADKKFIDFLFTILSLHVGTVVKLLSTGQSTHMVWSLGNLYRSVETLNINCFEPNNNKDGLLNPKIPATTQSQLQNLLQIQSSSSPTPTSYYTCSTGKNTICRRSFSATFGATCTKCYKSMTSAATYVYGVGDSKPVEGGYVKGGVFTYLVMDDLTVKPISSSKSTISVLNQLHVEDIGQIEEKLVYLDMNEGLNLLRASLQSFTVLTDVFLHKIDFPTTPSYGKRKVTIKRKR